MPQFAIMRCKKLTSMGSAAAALQHCYRERETPNADQARTPDNEHLVSTSTDQAMGVLRNRLPEKRRKDAVLAVEYVMTASPEWWSKAGKMDEVRFVEQSMAWLEGKYGKENVIAATVHRDELTPHVSAFVVPITADGRLSAKEFIGNKAKMTQDQTSFALSVEHLGLERGIEGSKARHQRVKSFYADINRGSDIPVFTEQELKAQKVQGDTFVQKLFNSAIETPFGITERLNEKIKKAVSPAIEKASMARLERLRADEMRRTAESKDRELKAVLKRLEPVERLFKGLSQAQARQVFDMLTSFREANQREIDERRQMDVRIRELERAKTVSVQFPDNSRNRGGPSR